MALQFEVLINVFGGHAAKCNRVDSPLSVVDVSNNRHTKFLAKRATKAKTQLREQLPLDRPLPLLRSPSVTPTTAAPAFSLCSSPISRTVTWPFSSF